VNDGLLIFSAPSAWVLDARFDVAEHQQLANPDTNQIFTEYVKGIFRGLAPYLAHSMKGTSLADFHRKQERQEGCQVDFLGA
jgi:hypothetical protein